MAKHKLTPWFPADVKPVNVGWYETNNPFVKEFTVSEYQWYWSGKEWCFDSNGCKCDQQNRQWRGIQE